MPEFVILLRPGAGSASIPHPVARAHCEHLDRLAHDARLIAAGPFTDAEHGGMVIGIFETAEAARSFADVDPFVVGGHRTAEVRPWGWSRPQNGHMGVLAPAPGTHPGFLTSLHLRATTRDFSDRPVSTELVRSLLGAALAAPSEFNLQPWRPVVCHADAERRRLMRCCHDQSQIEAAGVAVICAVDPDAFHHGAPDAVDQLIARSRWPAAERQEQIDFVRSCYADPAPGALRNGVIFGHQLLLAGLSQGLAGFWLGGLDAPALRREFEMPERALVAGVVGLGWPAGPQPPMQRLPAEQLVGWGRWPGAG